MKPMKVDEDIFKRVNCDDYIMEKKYDGYRVIIQKDITIKLFSRHKNRFDIPTNLIDQLNSMQIPNGTVFDGEIWNLNKRGSWNYSKEDECKITLWDTMIWNHKDVTHETIEKRYGYLSGLTSDCGSINVISRHEVNPTVFNQIKKDAYEHRKLNDNRSGFIHGVVLKKKESMRRDDPKRTKEHPDWLKIVLF